MPARLADLVALSREVAATRARNGKLERIAAFLRPLDATDAALAVSYLSGDVPQGKTGVGWATVSTARDTGSPASEATLTLRDVDAVYDALANQPAGAGSTRARKEALGGLFARATQEEREFLAMLT